MEMYKVGRYLVDSLQIYFPASLEIQEELINNGFYVPRSPDRKVSMPIPIVYSDFGGRVISIERLIPPEWLEISPEQLGWEETYLENKRGFKLPKEEVYVDVSISNDSIIFELDVKNYHLERTSIRGINPEKWKNWVMFYIDLKYVDEFINALREHIPAFENKTRVIREKQQGGKEVTYYAKVNVKNFSLCLGCFDLAQRYLQIKAKEHCNIYPGSPTCNDSLSKLKLRLEYDPSITTFAKVGIAKISGKRPQIMVKLTSTETKTIRGILKPEIKGKARGKLVYCDHREKRQYIALDLFDFYKALVSTKKYEGKLPTDD
ncbi:hypothetical protein [Pyrococcus horikoshii]|uniref:PhoI n=2 Tax=Pyrococcus horikoshii TaxID=53953 RepID=O58334_PYRHO|nr:hypothetical protein [Pyrococcus horikoshii]BAA29672.1 318aa long hypothetical protein [Pyrococcus horikoshii OT3]